MVRIAGVNLPDKKRIDIALTSIYGVGRSSAQDIVGKARIDAHKRTGELQTGEVSRLREMIEKDFRIEGDLRREIMTNIKRLKDIGSWRGSRHRKGLPVYGQRTKSNSRTRRGNVRKTMGSGKRTADKK